MKNCLRCLAKCMQILFCIRKKIVYIGGTDNVNLGDNAQRMLIRKWCKKNYPHHAYIEVSVGETCAQPFGLSHYWLYATLSFVLYGLLKIKQRRGDLIVTGSGYGFIDHAWNWLAYARAAKTCQGTPILIMPQTINFMNPWVEETAAKVFNAHPKILLLCRDFVSLDKAKKVFPNCNPMPFPDIVTSMIGTMEYKCNREGVLFCVRDDGEALYKPEEIMALKRRFLCRAEERDTTLAVTSACMHKHPDKYIREFLDYMSSFQVVITDRYHGTIFSLVANTPVVVLSSTDHKLSSGVKWFPPEIFGSDIRFADTLEKAYEIANEHLGRKEFPTLAPYFKDKYWKRLKEIVDETLLSR